ncbi:MULTISPECIES: aspartate ammonia-lyase [unclassified Pseudodesulfovibrio]|uniref:aspartate ammonia-lyase n=1 Tax=unclassified Pseudodesulfovibrio TaxID=2661612 RepID=UPI000FEBE5B1|nr:MULTISPECIES: aspartate ammonia-lyase [unclassified Pseudodesulfovibrio]MCJ2163424.1 aspartate ammonia-lyase [Pseudodesulfovibrio sp. S3-i]RWU06661.1 aspartate ammonia-lyase [Pseudodesulfovibrio sp. S3]
MKTRTEHDFLGEKTLAAETYYGVQTLRAVENFKITDNPISSCTEMIVALGYVKKAAALTNLELGILPADIAKAICGACNEIIAGKLHDQFVVDCIQGGAGTSTNMNANEVIANRALEILGKTKGEYEFCHPNNHVNCSQSTNDVYPTAFRIALYNKLERLIRAINEVQSGFANKGAEFADVLKMGRTQLQDAVPMTLGQEFSAYATTLGEDICRLQDARKLLLEINIGATAIGTSINAPSEYPRLAVSNLRNLTGLDLVISPNLIEATWDTGAYMQLSGVLKRVAVKLSKICNDLRLLSSGPRTGINEINLPKMQPGSSIMPGKVNPVIPEMVNQVAFDIIGKDMTITMASEAGQLQLNVMEPIIAHSLFQGIEHLARACFILRKRCIDGITANREHCRKLVENSVGIITALNPIIGYENSASVAKEALETGGSVYDLIIKRKLMDKEKLDRILSAENMMHPRFFQQ